MHNSFDGPKLGPQIHAKQQFPSPHRNTRNRRWLPSRAVDPFFHLVEEKLRDAERKGAFANLAGRGQPLELTDLDGVPAELRAGYLLLRSNGFVPPELEARKEFLRLGGLLAACTDPRERRDLDEQRRRAWLRYRLLAEERAGSAGWIDYGDRIVERLDRR